MLMNIADPRQDSGYPPEGCINDQTQYPLEIPDRPENHSARHGFFTPLEAIEYCPGVAVRILNEMPNFVLFVDYIGNRLASTGLDVRFVLEQLHTHPEISLDELCTTLSRLAKTT